jgi:hypothetical protein
MASIYHVKLFCIDVEAGIMEDCPATFLISPGRRDAELIDFRIGNWTGDRAAAVAMTGDSHVAMQEALAFEEWQEADIAAYRDRIGPRLGDWAWG